VGTGVWEGIGFSRLPRIKSTKSTKLTLSTTLRLETFFFDSIFLVENNSVSASSMS